MKKIIIPFILLAVVILAAPFFAEDKIIGSTWSAALPQIDGQALEWAQDVLETQKSEGVSFAFKNDAAHLFVLLIFNESKTLSSIAATGMTFWINPENKKKKTYGMRFYQKQVSGQQLAQEMEAQGEKIPDDKKEELLKSKSRYRLYTCDALNKKGEISPHTGKGIATYRVGKSGNNLVYEFVIPMTLLADPVTQAPIDVLKPFKFGFEWGGMTEEMKKAQAANLGVQGSRAMAGETSLEATMSGGDESVRDPGADMSSMRRRLPKKYDFWISLKIAANVS